MFKSMLEAARGSPLVNPIIANCEGSDDGLKINETRTIAAADAGAGESQSVSHTLASPLMSHLCRGTDPGLTEVVCIDLLSATCAIKVENDFSHKVTIGNSVWPLGRGRAEKVFTWWFILQFTKAEKVIHGPQREENCEVFYSCNRRMI